LQSSEDQVKEMLRFVRSKVGNSKGLAIILGDFNAGPGYANVPAGFEESYQEVIDAGYKEAISPQQTYGGFWDASHPAYVDHILAKGKARVRKSANNVVDRDFCFSDSFVFFNESIESFTINGQTVLAPPSDHYGVFSQICVKPKH